MVSLGKQLLVGSCLLVVLAACGAPVGQLAPAMTWPESTPAPLAGSRSLTTPTPRPTIVIELTPNRSANIVAAEPDTMHAAPEWLQVRWVDGVNTGYALAGFGIEGLNKSGVLTVSLVITMAPTMTTPLGFYVCKPEFFWDEQDTWHTHEAHCYGARVPFTTTGTGTYLLDVTAMTKASQWVVNRGYQFR